MLHLPLKPSPNETTTPALSARGPRRAALGSGPWGLALRLSSVWIGLSNPRVRVRDTAEYIKSYERLG